MLFFPFFFSEGLKYYAVSITQDNDTGVSKEFFGNYL